MSYFLQGLECLNVCFGITSCRHVVHIKIYVRSVFHKLKWWEWRYTKSFFRFLFLPSPKPKKSTRIVFVTSRGMKQKKVCKVNTRDQWDDVKVFGNKTLPDAKCKVQLKDCYNVTALSKLSGNQDISNFPSRSAVRSQKDPDDIHQLHMSLLKIIQYIQICFIHTVAIASPAFVDW